MAHTDRADALPLIFTAPGEDTFQVGEAAVEFLESIDRPVAVVIVAGRYRSGKSFLLNRLLGVHGFGVGHTVESHTKGIWVSSRILKGKTEDGDDIDVLVMDSEGLGATERSEQYDSTVFALATLLSSTLVFNGGSTIDETSLESLGFVVNLSKHIRIRSASDGDGGKDEADFVDKIQAFTPSFVYVLRDFSLELVDDDGDHMSPDEYLEAALEERDGFDVSVRQRNRIRHSIRSFFRHRRCVPLPRPVEEESSLQQLDSIPDEDLRAVFRDELDRLRGILLNSARPKRLGPQVVTGPFLATMTRAYVDGINDGGVPSIGDAWQSAAEDQCRRLAEAMETWTRQRLTPPPAAEGNSELPSALPVDALRLEAAVHRARQGAVAKYRAQLPPQAGRAGETHQRELEERIDRIAESLRQNNAEESDRMCHAEAQRLVEAIVEPLARRAGGLARDAVREADALQAQSGPQERGEAGGGEQGQDASLVAVESARTALIQCMTDLFDAWNSMEREYETQARGPAKAATRLRVSVPALVRAGGSVMRSLEEASDALGRLTRDARNRLERRASHLQERVDSLQQEVSATMVQLQAQTRATAKNEARVDSLEQQLETTKERLRESKDALEETRETLASTEAEVRRLQEKERSLQEEFRATRDRANRAEQALETVRGDHASSRRRVEELEREVQQWQQDCERLSSDTDTLRENHERLKQEGASSELERRKLVDTCSRYESRIRDLEEQVQSSHSALERERVGAETQQELHQEETKSLERQLEAVSVDRGRLREELAEAQKETATAQRKMAQQNEVHKESLRKFEQQMEERNQAWQSYADSLQDQVTKAHEAKRSLEGSLKEQHATELSSLREQHSAEVDSLRTLCETLRSEAREEAESASNRKAECGRLRDALQTEREELEATRAEAAEEEAQRSAAWQKERSMWEKRAGDAEAKVQTVQQEWKEELAKWEQEKSVRETEAHEERCSLQKEIERIKAELDAAMSQKGSLEDTVRSLEKETDGLEAALQRARDESQSAYAEQDSMRSELREARRVAEAQQRRSQEAITHKEERITALQHDLESHQSRLQMAEESLVTAAETLQDSHRELCRLEEQCDRLRSEARESDEGRIAAEHSASDAEARARRVLAQREESEAIWHETESKLREELRELRASQRAAETAAFQLRTEREDARSAQRAADRQRRWFCKALARTTSSEAALREGASKALQDAAAAVLAREQRVQDLTRAKANLRRRLRRHRTVETVMRLLRAGSTMTVMLGSESEVPAWVTADEALEIAYQLPQKRRRGTPNVTRVPWETVRRVTFGPKAPSDPPRGTWARQVRVEANQAPHEIAFVCSSTDEALRWVFGLRCCVLDRVGMDRFSLSPVAVKLERAGLRLAAEASEKRQSVRSCLDRYRERARREFAPALLARAFKVVLLRGQRRRLEAMASGLRTGLEDIPEPEEEDDDEDSPSDEESFGEKQPCSAESE